MVSDFLQTAYNAILGILEAFQSSKRVPMRFCRCHQHCCHLAKVNPPCSWTWQSRTSLLAVLPASYLQKKGSKDSRNLWHSERGDLVIRIPYFTELFGNLCVKVAISHTIIALVASAPTGEN